MKAGRVSKERRRRREIWIQDHPANHQGAWVCYLCGQWVYKEDMELDHVEPKSSTPKKIADSDDNLRPSHYLCNRNKGSSRVPEPRSIRNRPNVW
jgi:5-methylcytosine-specific restriction endonuclease McrA